MEEGCFKRVLGVVEGGRGKEEPQGARISGGAGQRKVPRRLSLQAWRNHHPQGLVQTTRGTTDF